MSSRAEMADHIGGLMDGTLDGPKAQQFLTEHSIASLTPASLAGAVDAVMARALPFPEFTDAIDCCGTGGDGLSTYNISTATALVIASAGIRVAKHGNRAVSSTSGSADVLQALGVKLDLTAEQSADLLRTTNICFLFAPQFHPGFARIAPLRKAIGTRTIFNILGPLCNPARVRKQLIGVFDRSLCMLIAEASQLLERECVIVAHGARGEDELSIIGESHLCALHEGYVAEGSFFPHDVGLNVAAPNALVGGDATYNAQALRAALEGTPSAYADAIMLNAAAGFIVAGTVSTLTEGIALARQQIHTGAALNTLEALITASHSYV